MGSNIRPCKDCSRRSIGCHSVCGDYAEYRKWLDDLNEKNKLDDLSKRVMIDGMRRCKETHRNKATGRMYTQNFGKKKSCKCY